MTSQRSLNEKLIAETRAKVEQEITELLLKVVEETQSRQAIIELHHILESIRTSSYRKELT